jgi:hypothetical protein
VTAAGDDVARVRDCGTGWQLLFVKIDDADRRRLDLEDCIDLGRIEPRQVELIVDLKQVLQLIAQVFLVPAGILGDPVEGDPQRLDRGRVVRPDDDGWDAVEAELFAELPHKHAVYYVAIRIGDDRRHDAVLADDPGELSLLGAIMGAHRTLRRAEVVDRALGDFNRRTGRIHGQSRFRSVRPQDTSHEASARKPRVTKILACLLGGVPRPDDGLRDTIGA